MTLSDSGAAEAVAPADDLRADLEAAFTPSSDAAEAEPGIGHNGGPEIDNEQPARERDPATGRFAGKAQEASSEAPEPVETAEGATTPPDASKPVDRLAAPEGWPSDAATAWDRLPRAAQEALKADLDARRLSLGTPTAAPDPVREAIKAYEPEIARRGVPAEHAIKALFEAQRMLDANPVEGIKWLARSYGVDLANTASPGVAQEPQQYVDPTVNALSQEVAELKGYLTQQQRAQHEARVAEQQRTIDAFAQEKAADGTPLRPHFDAVKLTMGRMLQSGEAADLSDAYDKAVWSRPDIRQRIMESERKAEAARREAEQRKATEEARKRAVSVRSNPSVSAGPAPPADLRAAIESAWGG